MKSSKRQIFCKDRILIRVCPNFLRNGQILHIYVKDKDLLKIWEVPSRNGARDDKVVGMTIVVIVKKYKSLALTN